MQGCSCYQQDQCIALWFQVSAADRLAAVFIVLTFLCNGCASWDAPGKPFQLPVPVANREATTLEVAILELPGDEDLTSIWREIDETPIPTSVREVWLQNGMRIGIVSGQLPERLRPFDLEKRNSESEQSSSVLLTDAGQTRCERRQCRIGEPEVINLLERTSESTLIWNEGGRLVARTLPSLVAQLHIAIKKVDGSRVMLELFPVAAFGEMKQRIIGSQGAFRYDTTRQSHTFSNLAVPLSVPEGETVLITRTDVEEGIGGAFFGGAGGRDQSKSVRRVVLLRVTQIPVTDAL